MKLFTKTSRLHFSYAFALACSSWLHAADTITIGTGTAFTNASAPAPSYGSKAYDRYTGTLYLGTNNASDLTYSISLVGRNDLAVTPLGTNAGLATLAAVNNLELIKPTRQAATMLAYTRSDTTAVTGGTANKFAWILPLSGTNALVPSQAGGAIPLDGNGVAGNAVSLITTGSTRIFARVQTTAGSDNIVHSGIAHYLLTDPNTPVFTIIDGIAGHNAATLDKSIQPVKSPNNTGAAPGGVWVNDMEWDDDLQTLYVGLFTQVPAASSGRGLVKGQLNATGHLTISAINATDSLISDTSGLFSINTSGAAAQNICINKIRVMTTSTGLKYLIFNGGMPVTAGTDVSGNEVWALRLAQTSGTNFSQGDVIANDQVAESALPASFSNLEFTISAQVGGKILDLDTTITVSDMIVVADTVFVSTVLNTRTQTSNGDAVKDPGIFFSRAMFNEDGLIVGWTPWQRAYPSVGNASRTQGGVEDDSAPFFQVDAVTGKIWKARSDGKGLYRNKWLLPASATTNGLQSALCTSLFDGCYCMLDLPNGTPGIGIANSNDRNSFALFGGNEKVAFARTQSGGNGTFVVTVPAANTFADPSTNFRTTTLPSGVGPVRSLGYTYRQDAGTKTDGFFFAGTNNGLYALAATTGNTGFNTTAALTDLNSAPFATGTYSWQQVGSAVIGNAAISHIVTGSNYVYFTTIDTTSTGSVSDQLYSIPLATPDTGAITAWSTTISALTPTLKAQSGFGGLPINAVFTGFTLVANNTFDGFFGVLTTNNGIYTTTCDARDLVQSAIATDTSGLQEWRVVPYTAGIAFSKLAPYKDARYTFSVNASAIGAGFLAYVNSTNSSSNAGVQVLQQRNRSFEALYLADDSRNLGIYNRSRIFQGGSHGPATRTNALTSLVGKEAPVLGTPNNSGTDTATADLKFATNNSLTINDIDSSVSYKSDGARRFVIRFSPDESGTFSGLRLIPYYGDGWGLGLTGPLADSTLATVPRMFCMEFISGTGHFFIGTDTGVISLE